MISGISHRFSSLAGGFAMRMKLHLLTLLIGGLVFAFTYEACATVTAVAVLGQNVPEGDGQFNASGLPMINNAGQLAFRSTLSNTSLFGSNDTGIYMYSNGTLSKVARENEAPPDGNGLIDGVASPFIDSSGKVTFLETFKNTSNAPFDNNGIYRYNGAVGTKLVRKGDTAPDGNGTFSDLTPKLFNAGRMAFTGSLLNSSGGVLDDSGIYMHDGSQLVKVIRENETVPNTNGKYADPIFLSAMNVNGSLTYLSTLRTTLGGTTDNSAIYAAGVGTLEVVRKNDCTPNCTFRYSGFNIPDMNDVSQVAFLASMSGTPNGTADDTAAFEWHQTTGFAMVAHENDPVPEGNGQFDQFGDNISNALKVEIGGNGYVTFHASVKGATSGVSEDGIYLWNGTSLKKIARTNDTVPGGDGQFSTFATPTINANGHVLFRANLKSTASSSTNQAIYLYDGTSLNQVARKGDVIGTNRLGGSPFIYSAGCQDGWYCSLNDSDQVAFQASLNAGGTGVFLYTPGSTVTLPGDYNNNHVVDASDYVVWRKNLGLATTLPNDTTPGSVSQADYDVWRAHFGQTGGSATGAIASAAVPEPATFVMLIAGILAMCSRRHGRLS
jgi:hypothetical protein